MGSVGDLDHMCLCCLPSLFTCSVPVSVCSVQLITHSLQLLPLAANGKIVETDCSQVKMMLEQKGDDRSRYRSLVLKSETPVSSRRKIVIVKVARSQNRGSHDLAAHARSGQRTGFWLRCSPLHHDVIPV